MKKYLLALLLSVVVATTTWGAEYDLRVGKAFHINPLRWGDEEAVHFSIREDRDSLRVGLNVVQVGTSNTGVGIDGVGSPFRMPVDLDFILGVTYFVHPLFGDEEQFNFHVGASISYKQISVSWDHYSNGNTVFNRGLPSNRAYDFISIGYRF